MCLGLRRAERRPAADPDAGDGIRWVAGAEERAVTGNRRNAIPARKSAADASPIHSAGRRMLDAIGVTGDEERASSWG
ncbi:hypothetical protein GCM10027360_16740 [Amycolatopsis echigonensis]